MIFQIILLLFLEGAMSCEYGHLDAMHTMCMFAPRMCTGRKLIRSGGLNCMEKQIILDEHNNLRQRLANGKVKGQPAAMNMRVMVWDNELARVSQRWADQCMPGHDHSRNVDRFAVGQNVATTWSFEKEPPTKDAPEFKRHIQGWFNEVEKYGFKSSHIDPFMFKMNTGHYTQLVWAETYMVGCGYTYYKDPKRGYSKLYVCNYGPGGNFVGGSMYKMGFPGMMSCSGTGDDRQSSKYVGLCEVPGAKYFDHMCQDVRAPPLVEMPPSHHLPTPRPPQSIFHEMMGDNALSDLAMKSTHFLMMGMKQTMNLADIGMKQTMNLADIGMKHTMNIAGLFNPLSWAPRLAKPFQNLMSHMH